jgi:hypothetical protein
MFFVSWVLNQHESHHRVSPFELADCTKPGHRRFIALWLVDPNCRIISTANVPPQQLDWWQDAVLGSSPKARSAALSKLPPELISLIEEKHTDTDNLIKNVIEGEGVDGRLAPEVTDMVQGFFEANGAMTLDEAKKHRLQLMEERGTFLRTTDWDGGSYNFCEH